MIVNNNDVIKIRVRDIDQQMVVLAAAKARGVQAGKPKGTRILMTSVL